MTKKYFVSATLGKGPKKSDFIAPVRTSGKLSFISIKTGAPVLQFMSVFTGINLTPQEVFSKMIDAGLVIESVDQTFSDLENLLEQSKDSKLGYVYEPEPYGAEFEFKCLGKEEST